MKKVLIIFCCLFLLVGCGKKKEEKKEEKVEPKVEVKDVNVALGEEITNKKGIVNIEDGELVTEETQVDTSVLGEQKIVIVVKDKDGNEKEYSYNVIVEDKEVPVIEAKEQLTTEAGTKIDLLKNVKVTDNSGESIKATVEGEYDFSKVGNYKLAYVAKDSSGNEARKEFTLVVKEKKVVQPTPPSQPSTPTPPPVVNPDGTFTTSKGFSGYTKNGVTYINGLIIANKTYALPNSYAPGGLTGETKSAADRMFAAAKAERGFNMWAQSGYRSYDTQKRLYNNYVSQRGKAAADTFSARPGHSEHQTGLAFDVCATGKPCINSNFDNTEEAKWLAANAYKYGFILRYPSGKTNETGYKYESWHFRYVGVDLATQLYNGGNWITLENYLGITSQYNY